MYTGFWTKENGDANFVCLSATDEDPSQATEEKTASWRLTHTGGFYWAGSLAMGDAIIVGTDDGANGFEGKSKLYSLNKKTGEVISEMDLVGDQRSTISYCEENGRIYGTTKAGYLFSAAVDKKTGKLTDLKSQGYGAQSTSTPVVYKGKVYFATGSGISTTGSSGNIVVADATTLDFLYAVGLQGYPQSSVLLSTAYEKETGYIYLYSTYNNKPGGVSMVKTKADNTTAEGAELVELYDAAGYEQYCITSIVCDAEGTLYYKNDSCNIFALENNDAYLTKLQLAGGNVKMDKEFSPSNLSYKTTVDAGTKLVKATFKKAPGASVYYNGEVVKDGAINITMSGGTAKAELRVVNGKAERTYTVDIRESKDDATLSQLGVNETNAYGSMKTLTPAFDPAVKNYVFYGMGASRSFENVWPTAADSNATYKVYALYNVGGNTKMDEETGEIAVTSNSGGHSRYAIYPQDTAKKAFAVRVVVTAENGKDKESYDLVMTKEKTEAAIQSELEEIAKIQEEKSGDDVQKPAKSLDEIITEAKDELNQYVAFYFQPKTVEMDEAQAIVKNAVEEMNKASDEAKVKEIVKDAKASIDEVQKAAAEAEKLSESKVSAMEDLLDQLPTFEGMSFQDYKNLQDMAKSYKDAIAEAESQEEVDAIVAEAKAEIQKAADAAKSAVDTAAEEAKKQVEEAEKKAEDAAKQAAEEKKQAEEAAKQAAEIAAKEKALTTAKETATDNLLASVPNLSKYRNADAMKIVNKVFATQSKIGKAKSEAEIQKAVKSCKSYIAGIKTDAKIKKQAMAKAKISLKAKKVKKWSRKVKVSFTNVSEESGYQLQMKTGKGKWKTVKNLSANKTTYRTKSMKRNTYKFRVRAYAKVNGKKVYSKWSKTKSVRVR